MILPHERPRLTDTRFRFSEIGIAAHQASLELVQLRLAEQLPPALTRQMIAWLSICNRPVRPACSFTRAGPGASRT